MLASRYSRYRLLSGILLTMLVLTSVIVVVAWRASNNVAAICPVSLPTQTSPTQKNATIAPPLYLGLDAYRHWDKLSYLELGDRVDGQSTADPAGSNTDSIHYLRILPDGEHVLFDQIGPGIVTFSRMQETTGGPWNLLLDGHLASSISAKDLGQLSPTSNPAAAFPYPLSLNTQESQGSSIIASAIPYQKSIQWTSQQPNANFYLLYRKLPYGTPITTWDSAMPTQDVVALLRCAGSDIAPVNIAQQNGNLTLSSKQATPITMLSGPSQIRALTFHVPYAEKVRFGNSRLLIYWDGEKVPSVDAPIKFLVGDGAGVYQPAQRPLVQGWIAGANGDGSTYMNYNLYWPMPFAKSVRIGIVSNDALQHIAWSVRYEPFLDPTNWWGTFHATYTSVPKPVAGQDMTFLNVQGSGKLVGTVVNFTRPGGTLEGDPHIYIDDSRTAQIAVTGTEEWGLGGDYWNGGVQTSLPLGGLPSSVNNPPGTNHDGAALYRFLIADSIPFNRHLTVRWEHGGGDQSTLPYRATILWYGTPVQTALLSDTVLPTSLSSRSAHGYTSPGERQYQLTSAYEYTVNSPLSTATGTSMTGTTSFTMALDPHNVGAFLRRTFDYCVPNQRANVFVDGHFAGTWYTAGVSSETGVDGHSRCWRDEDFPLPASLTQGNSSVTVRIQFVPTSNPQNSDWTAFNYQMYSFVLPPLTKS
ncbi:MAG TPA: DUF2961 domain-containing protein [Ktedonobacteraceae bacterium]|nr:DUF2961 domain-containing protein [Ktedonobacteraceae bacterium]